ncbi:MAG TPA: FMN-binding protein [Methylomirabilota bacterium]|nr:FMN-binding protein [Methylomirabilota bacterium]
MERAFSLAVLTAALLLFSRPASAERFLTIDEARRLCFPEAQSFEAQVVRFGPGEAKAIEQRSGVKVLNKGNRIWLARSGTNVVGVLVLDYVLGKHELIDYAVAIETNGTVRQVEILEYRESYGGEIRGSQWRSQFRGKTPASPLKLNGDIRNISGATISCRNVSEGIKRVLATYDLVVRPRLWGPGGLPNAPARRP